MPELTAILVSSRKQAEEQNKFAAAIQGIDLDGDKQEEDPWEKLKAKVASRGRADSAKDVLALQGTNAKSKGFGIGLGLDAEVIDSSGNVTKLG